MASSLFKVKENGKGTQVAVGANGTALISFDSGESWIKVNAGTENKLNSVAFGSVLGSEVWVAVGDAGTVVTSYDAISWTRKADFTDENLNGIAFGGVFMVVGDNGTLGLSDDLGETFVPHDPGTTEDLLDVTVDLGEYLIVGENDTVVTGTVSTLELECLIVESVNVAPVLSSAGTHQHSITESIETLESSASGTQRIVEIAVGGTVEAGDVYTIIVGETEYTYIAQEGDTTTTVAAELAALVNANPEYTATSDGAVITIVVNDPNNQTAITTETVNGGAVDDQTLGDSVIDGGSTTGTIYYQTVAENIFAVEVNDDPNGVYQASAIEGFVLFNGFPYKKLVDVTFAEVINLAESSSTDLLIFSLDINESVSAVPILFGFSEHDLSFSDVVNFDGSAENTKISDCSIVEPFSVGTSFDEVSEEYLFGIPSVWVVNTKTGAHSTYANFNCVDIAEFNGKQLAVFEEGLYELGGENDDGVDIDAKIYWVPSSLGTPKQKRIESIHIVMRNLDGNDLKLVTITDEVEERIYTKTIASNVAGLKTYRQLTTKGLSGTIWQVGIENTNSGDFVVDSAVLNSIELSRHFK
jgi:hypothetical protein